MDVKKLFPLGSRVELKRDYFVHNPHCFQYINIPDKIFGEVIDHENETAIVKLDTHFTCTNSKRSNSIIDKYWSPISIITLISTPHTPPPTKIDYLKINQECSNL